MGSVPGPAAGTTDAQTPPNTPLDVVGRGNGGAVPAPPGHVALIMDGNGRWAIARGQPRAAGRSAGAEAVRRRVQAAIRRGVAVSDPQLAVPTIYPV